MSNKSSIKAFSLSSYTESTLNKLQNKFQKNRSQLIREAIDYFDKSNKINSATNVSNNSENNSFSPNQILKNYYELISAQKPKPTLVIGVAIISRSHKVLIGQRKHKDPHLKHLSWTFPSGKFSSLNFEKEIVSTVLRETHLNCKPLNLVHARLIPDSPAKKIRIIALYYHCKISSIKALPGGDFKTLKWVPAVDVTEYFTTSVSDEIMNFLGTL